MKRAIQVLLVACLMGGVGLYLPGATAARAGTIAAWGWNSHGQVGNTPAGDDFIAIAAADKHSLAVHEDGSIVAWGNDGNGQVGGPNSDTDTFTAVAGGWNHSLALTSTGSITAWGDNGNGQVSGPNDAAGVFTAIAACANHSLAVTSTGAIAAWGMNSEGQVGNAPDVTLETLGAESFWGGEGTPNPWYGAQFVDVAAGPYQSLAVTSTGEIAAWGQDNFGQVSGPNDDEGTFDGVAGGFMHSLGLKSDGTLVAWGDEFDSRATDAPDEDDFIAVAAAWAFDLALDSDGAIAAWGVNDQNGISDTPDVNDSGDSWYGTRFVVISAGGAHGMALTPEPATLALLALGGLGLLARRRRRS